MINDRPDFKGHAATIREAARQLCAKCGRSVTGNGTPPFADCDENCTVTELFRIADDIEQSSRSSKQSGGPRPNRPCTRRSFSSS